MALENETFLTCSGSDRRPKRQKLSVSERLETRRVSQLRGLLSSRVVKDGASLRGAVSVGPKHETDRVRRCMHSLFDRGIAKRALQRTGHTDKYERLKDKYPLLGL